MEERITLKEAATMMGTTPGFVAAAMQEGIIDIGTALKKPGASRYSYLINPYKLHAYIEGRNSNQSQTEKEAEIKAMVKDALKDALEDLLKGALSDALREALKERMSQ